MFVVSKIFLDNGVYSEEANDSLRHGDYSEKKEKLSKGAYFKETENSL